MTTNAELFLQTASQCLCPPGDGVFTVNTAKERKALLRQALFGEVSDVRSQWLAALAQYAAAPAPVAILGISSDCGGGILRGANWGPLFLRLALLQQQRASYPADLGDIRVIPHLLHDKYLNDETITNCRKALYQNAQQELPVSPLSLTEQIADMFYQAFPDKGIFGIGGDHSVSYPLTKSYLKARRAAGVKTAIIHFDAHTDLLTERLGIDLCFGSWCTHILEYLPAPSHLIQLGIRSSGKPKAHWESTFGVRQFWADEIRLQGAEAVAQQIVNQLKADAVDELYVSFDIDALDAEFAAATGTPETGGMTPEQALTIIEILRQHFPIAAADMMEIAPFTDSTGLGAASTAKTLQVGAQLSACLLDAISQR